jgi:hypothetical protein
MAQALGEADLSASVTACPGWTVRELAGHLTGAHRWVLAALSSEVPPPLDATPDATDPVGAYAEAAAEMLSALSLLPPDRPCWTFDRTNRTTSFWRRRQLHSVGPPLGR